MIDTSWLFGGAAIAGVTAAWAQIRSLLANIASFAVMNVQLQGDESKIGTEAYCWQQLRRSPTGFRHYVMTHMFVRPRRRIELVGYEQLGESTKLFWKGWRPILIHVTPAKHENNSYRQAVVSLTFMRGTFRPDQLTLEIVQAANQTRATTIYGDPSAVPVGNGQYRRFRIERISGSGRAQGARAGGLTVASPNGPGATYTYLSSRPIGFEVDELGVPPQPGRPLDRMALTPELEEAVAEAQRWLDAREWYQERCIAWRRGWLLHGRPGTGKSTFARSIAQQLDLPLYCLDIGSMTNDDFCKAWQTVRAAQPAMVLIEDIDGVFDGRTNRLGENGGGLTFDCLLNQVGGVEDADGVFLVITTNNLDKIDPALGRIEAGQSSRPGRIDRVLELSCLDAAGRRKIARRILADCPDLIDRLVAEGSNDTGAQFQERCTVVALRQRWAQAELRRAEAG